MIALAAPPIDQLLGAVVLLELVDQVTDKIALAPSTLERARQHTERAWLEMRLRDRHQRGSWAWRRWDTLMQADTALAERFVLERGR